MLRLFIVITNYEYELKEDAWVKFDWDGTSISYLFPNGPPTVGGGFVKETNGWKITIIPIVDPRGSTLAHEVKGVSTITF